jgi:hypothetical protein
MDLTSSSPPPEIPVTQLEHDETPRSSSPIEYGSTDEEEVSPLNNPLIKDNSICEPPLFVNPPTNPPLSDDKFNISAKTSHV